MTSFQVLLTSHYFPPHVGGIENVVQSEALHLAAAGHRVSVLTSATRREETRLQVPSATSVYRCTAWNGMEVRFGVPFPIFAPGLLWRSFGLVRNADVVHAHDAFYMTSWAVALWCRILRRPLIVTQHVQMIAHPSRLVRKVQSLVYRTTGRFVLSTATQVCVVNSGVARFLEGLGVPKNKITPVPNGVDVELFRPVDDPAVQDARISLGLPADKILALFVGRFVPKKGFTRLLNATSDQYVIVFAGGDAPIDNTEIGDSIFLGSLDAKTLSTAYQACDMFVLPSEAEGFPLTVQEAMASGLPVITTDDPGYDIYNLDPTSVKLISTNLDELRQALVSLATEPDLRHRMSSYSREYASEHFSWSTHVDRLCAIYEESCP